MKKIFFLLTIAALCFIEGFAQSRIYASTNSTNKVDTLTNAGTTVFNTPAINSGETVSLQIKSENISGTTGYVARVKASLQPDSVGYAYILPTDTLAGAGSASYKIWSIPREYKYYQLEVIQTGTQSNKVRVYYTVNK